MRATLKLLSHLLLASSFAITTNVLAEEKKAEAPLHKFSGSYGVDYLFEPRASVTGTGREYKKQRAIIYPSAKYTYASKYSLALSPEFRFNNGYQKGGYNTRPGKIHLARGLVTAMVNNVLTEEHNGLKLDLGYVRRIFNQTTNPGNYGNHRLRAYVSKKVNDSLNFSVNNDFMYSARNTWSPVNTSEREDPTSIWKFLYNPISTVNLTLSEKLSFTFYYDWNLYYYHKDYNDIHRVDFVSENSHILTYTINDTYSAGSNFKYSHSISRSGDPSQSFEFAPFVSKNLTDKISLSFEVNWLTHQANDSEDGIAPRRHFWQYPDLAIYYSQVLF